MSRLLQNSLPAERARGLVFSETFETPGAVVRNRGAITGAPSINFGATFDGSNDYVDYAFDNEWKNPTYISVVCEFVPHNAYDEDATRYIFSIEQNYWISKQDSFDSYALLVRCGGTDIAYIPSATYSPYWYVDERNLIGLISENGDTTVLLNGQVVLDSDATAYTPSSSNDLIIGASSGLAQNFDGVVKYFKLFNVLLTRNEVLDYNACTGGAP